MSTVAHSNHTNPQVDELKALGNKAFSAGNFSQAVTHFQAAIALDSSNHVLHSNLSAAYASLKDYQSALAEAEKTVDINPSWAKVSNLVSRANWQGWGRKGAALSGLLRYEEAAEAYQKGLELDSSSALLKKGFEEAQDAMSQNKPEEGLGKLFSGDIWTKIANNPSTAHLLADKDFIEKVKQIQKNPSTINSYLQDPRIMTLLMALMGINATGQTSPTTEEMQDSYMPRETDDANSTPAKRAPSPEPKKETVEPDTNKQQAIEAKNRGNEFYKKRMFNEALAEYVKGKELDPTNISIYTNEAAVYYETEKYDECIRVCKEAVELGREHRVDYKMIAKALGRIGNACTKMENYEEAVKYYNKSLTEHRTADILTKLREAERLQKEKEKAAYNDPELAEKAREEGNRLFKGGQWAKAVEQYSEAIKRNEDDPRAYSNRAACYTKLMAFPEALKDCESCLKRDPKFIKGYIRKAAIEFLKREYTRCLETCEQAMQQDTEGKHKAEIETQMHKCYAATQGSSEDSEDVRQRAANDPEVQSILSDPVMRQILDQMQKDPMAAQDHLKNPVIAAKIKKLIAAGIIRIG